MNQFDITFALKFKAFLFLCCLLFTLIFLILIKAETDKAYVFRESHSNLGTWRWEHEGTQYLNLSFLYVDSRYKNIDSTFQIGSPSLINLYEILQKSDGSNNSLVHTPFVVTQGHSLIYVFDYRDLFMEHDCSLIGDKYVDNSNCKEIIPYGVYIEITKFNRPLICSENDDTKVYASCGTVNELIQTNNCVNVNELKLCPGHHSSTTEPVTTTHTTTPVPTTTTTEQTTPTPGKTCCEKFLEGELVLLFLSNTSYDEEYNPFPETVDESTLYQLYGNQFTDSGQGTSSYVVTSNKKQVDKETSTIHPLFKYDFQSKILRISEQQELKSFYFANIIHTSGQANSNYGVNFDFEPYSGSDQNYLKYLSFYTREAPISTNDDMLSIRHLYEKTSIRDIQRTRWKISDSNRTKIWFENKKNIDNFCGMSIRNYISFCELKVDDIDLTSSRVGPVKKAQQDIQCKSPIDQCTIEPKDITKDSPYAEITLDTSKDDTFQEFYIDDSEFKVYGHKRGPFVISTNKLLTTVTRNQLYAFESAKSDVFHISSSPYIMSFTENNIFNYDGSKDVAEEISFNTVFAKCSSN